MINRDEAFELDVVGAMACITPVIMNRDMVSFTIRPKDEISLQHHAYRNVHWYIVNGKGIVTKSGNEIGIFAGDFVDLPLNYVHNIRNIGN